MSTPFDDLRHILSQLPAADACAAKKILTKHKLDTVPALDQLLGVKCWLAQWQANAEPAVDEAHICILASSYVGESNDLVKQFIKDAASGRAPVNRLCVDRGVGLRVLELAPDLPHDTKSAWNEQECMGAVAFGMEATAAGGHLLGLSDIAPGNKVYALAVIIMGSPIQDRPKLVDALMAAAHEEGPESVSCLKDAVAIVSEQLASLDDPLEALRLYGGREIAASVGAIVAARSRRLPVVVDGWAAIAAMAVLNNECPGSIDHVYIASTDSGLMGRILPSIGKSALLGVKVDTGAGCGNAISVSILKAACDL